MRIVLAGASGFLGRRLTTVLTAGGHRLTTLVRREPDDPNEVRWDPDAAILDRSVLEGADAAVNLCGVGVGDKRWTSDYKRLIRSSRINSTSVLASACADVGVPALINASAVGYYGDTGDHRVDESDPAGHSFLAGVCLDWEAATGAASAAGVRVAMLRSGLILGDDGGLVPRLRTVVRLYAGGRLGSGKQFFPWVSVTDEVDAIVHLLTHDVGGPVNIVAPGLVTNAEFMKVFGHHLGRPTPWWVPSIGLHVVLGEFADELIAGQGAVPMVLQDSGFTFTHPALDEALTAELGR
jgi:uncharacterized protein (TIGR01777 family)